MAKDRFLAKGVSAKRRRNANGDSKSSAGNRGRVAAGAKRARDNIESSDYSGDEVGDIDDLTQRYDPDAEASTDDEFLETAAEKRLRLAKDYISKVRSETEINTGEIDAAQIDRDIIAERLLIDARERSGRWSRRIASNFASVTAAPSMFKILKNVHKRAVTCASQTPNAQFVYSGSKDGSLAKWDRTSGKILKVFAPQKKKGPVSAKRSPGHCDHILCIAISSDGKYVATGGRDRKIHIWSVESDEHLATFHQHKDWVTGLVFRRGTNHLYSCSADRMVKMWNIDELAYMDTLFGHQDSITAIAALQREQAVTTGGRDKTARLWRIADEAQLVFRGGSTTDPTRMSKSLADAKKSLEKIDTTDGETQIMGSPTSSPNTQCEEQIKEHKRILRELVSENKEFREESIDAVAMIDEETYITGGDSGALCLWSTQKKKPVFIQHVAHGIDAAVGPDGMPHWITALATVPFTDLFVSGSNDGLIRIWKLRSGKAHRFDLVNTIPVNGFINWLEVREIESSDPQSRTHSTKDIDIVAAVGQEPRLGRWQKAKTRNNVVIVRIPG